MAKLRFPFHTNPWTRRIAFKSIFISSPLHVKKIYIIRLLLLSYHFYLAFDNLVGEGRGADTCKTECIIRKCICVHTNDKETREKKNSFRKWKIKRFFIFIFIGFTSAFLQSTAATTKSTTAMTIMMTFRFLSSFRRTSYHCLMRWIQFGMKMTWKH